MRRGMVSIIMVNWNGKELLRNCLKSVKENTKCPDYEVIVVDNASRDGSTEMLATEFGWVKVIKNKTNRGFAAANNQGFRQARGECIFMLNNDTLVTEGWLKNAVAVMEGDMRTGVVGCEEIRSVEDFRNGNYGKCRDRDVLTVSGATMLVRRSVLDNIGVLDGKEFSPAYGEESDFNYRAHNAGYRIVKTCRSSILHYGGMSSRRQLGAEGQYLLCNRHRAKAMLYNLHWHDFLKHVPGLGLLFLQAIRDGTAVLFLRAWASNLRNWRRILGERRARFRRAEMLREKIFGGEGKTEGKNWQGTKGKRQGAEK